MDRRWHVYFRDVQIADDVLKFLQEGIGKSESWKEKQGNVGTAVLVNKDSWFAWRIDFLQSDQKVRWAQSAK